jgi:two-component system chemotaxis sensor kinase CheA
MAEKDDDFLKRLMATFKIEAQEHIAAITSGLIELEKASEIERQVEIIETIFRETHSFKGAARSVNMTQIEATCQSLENIFAGLKRKEISLSPDLFDILHKAVDILSKLLVSAYAERPPIEESLIKEIIQQLENISKGGPPLPEQAELKKTEGEISIMPKTGTYMPPDEEKPMAAETIRISISKLDSVLLQAEELLSAKLSAHQRSSELQEINSSLAKWEKEWTKAVSSFKSQVSGFRKENSKPETRNSKHNSIHPQLDKFLDWNHNYIKSLEGKLIKLTRSNDQDLRSLSAMVDNLLNSVKNMLMLPFSSLLEIFPKLVRNLSHDKSKDVQLIIHGGDIEIDRRILEEMKDPLIHLVRNCIDHGIEKQEERVRRKKPTSGIIKINISRVNSHKVEILISDDGAGIDVAKVRESAVKVGVLSQEQADRLNEQELLSLIFLSGISTSPIITDISGRGLGLAIVREKVEKLGGIVSCESKLNVGTILQVILPMTLATFRGVLTRLDGQLFVLPTTNVDRIVRIKHDEIRTVEGKESISLNGEVVSLVRLCDVLELQIPPSPPLVKGGRGDFVGEESKFIHVFVLKSAEKRIAFSVDEVLNEQEVLVKSLGSQLSRVRNIAGATVLGTGKVVPILNIPDLMKSAVKVSAVPFKATVAEKEVKVKRKSILIVEDSITARTLLKNILETAGYNVKTAVDGIDALTALKTEDFDSVVSDVDMPRMNGFDLTAKIRSDRKLADLPVILVTALESREDRERGIDVGANAYIVKSSFDQSNLLETIKRLI